jgi:protein gp37
MRSTIDLARTWSVHTERDVRQLVGYLRDLRAHDWRASISGADDWPRFCREVLGHDPAFLAEVEEAVAADAVSATESDVVPTRDLADLAGQINREHERVEAALRAGLKHARAAGALLLLAKEQLAHGAWLPWLRANMRFSERAAQSYMRIADRWDELTAKSAPGADLTYKQALALLAEPAPAAAAARGRPADPEESRDPGPTGVVVHAEVTETAGVPEAGGRQPLALAEDAGEKYVTLEWWNGMTDARRRKALSPAKSGATFNFQGSNLNIEWARWSANPVSGCLHNCPYCYARDIAQRFYEQKFEPSLWPGRLLAFRNTHFPEDAINRALAEGTSEGKVKALGLRNVFVCSMADLFGRWVPSEWIEAVLDAVRAADPRWNFLFLTKFPIRMAEFAFPDNAWVGTTVDCQARVANAEKAFRKVKAGVKWLSCEPLLGPLKFGDLGAFDWVVLGGASKSSDTPEWRPPRRWVVDLEHEAWRAGCKVYEKTNLYPADVGASRVREYPGIDVPEPELPEALRYLTEVAE